LLDVSTNNSQADLNHNLKKRGEKLILKSVFLDLGGQGVGVLKLKADCGICTKNSNSRKKPHRNPLISYWVLPGGKSRAGGVNAYIGEADCVAMPP